MSLTNQGLCQLPHQMSIHVLWYTYRIADTLDTPPYTNRAIALRTNIRLVITVFIMIGDYLG